MGWWSKVRRVLPVKRFRKADGGVAALEFAFVGAPFIYLLCCIFETGVMLFSEYIIETGVSKAARMIRTGEVQKGGMSAGEFKDLVCGNLSAFLDCDSKLHVDVRKFTAFADITTPDAIDGDELSEDVTTGAQFQTGGPMEVVVVRAYYEWKLFMPGISKLANLSGSRRLLTSGAAFRNEPYQ